MSFSPTPEQARLLGFIKTELAERGFAPTFEEMRAHLGLAYKSGVHRLLVGLEERGHIRRLHYRSRAIEVVSS